MDDRNRDNDKLPDTCAQLRAENDKLKQLLTSHGIHIPDVQPPTLSTVTTPKIPIVTTKSSADAKIKLFRSLFRGREDVYALRWTGKMGKSGYSPACVRDWKAYFATDPDRRKAIDNQTRKLLPLTDEVIRKHLAGEHTVGLYPLLIEETCWFLAVDLDKKEWQADAAAFLRACDELRVPASLERSRSGNGGHVWIFFDQPIPAHNARQLGSLLLTRTMEQRHEAGLDSYDRFFPNQDTMPKGGFGNLIALPLQKVPREQGRSVFLDRDFCPHEDQWQFLSGVQRIPQDSVEIIINEASRKGEVIGVRMSITDDDAMEVQPWQLPASKKKLDQRILNLLPDSVHIVRANLIYIEKKDLPAPFINRLIRLAAFQNPEFYKAQAMRLSVFDKPRIISCSEDFPEHIGLPRGCLDEVISLFKIYQVRPRITDERLAGTSIEISFHGNLRELQHDAVARIIEHDDGVLCAPTAFGKTTVAAWLIAKRKVNTLILVHRRQLLDQWRERLALFLDIPINSVGQIGGGKTEKTGFIDVAVIQSLQRKGEVKDLVGQYGHVIVDECHHLSAFTFEQVLKQCKARYVIGLTATPIRKDGHHPIIFMQCGPLRYSVSARKMADARPFDHEVIPRPTEFRMPLNIPQYAIHDVYAALIRDDRRNDLIAEDVIQAVHRGRSPLVLTGRTEHLEQLSNRLAEKVPNVFILKGGAGKKQRASLNEALAAVSDSAPRVILATGSYIGEGFDDARLDTLFLAMAISWRGTLQQYAGRLHRLHDNKRVVQVYDYVDSNVPMLGRMYEKRLRGYEAIGYTVVRIGDPPQDVSASAFA